MQNLITELLIVPGEENSTRLSEMLLLILPFTAAAIYLGKKNKRVPLLKVKWQLFKSSFLKRSGKKNRWLYWLLIIGGSILFIYLLGASATFLWIVLALAIGGLTYLIIKSAE